MDSEKEHFLGLYGSGKEHRMSSTESGPWAIQPSTVNIDWQQHPRVSVWMFLQPSNGDAEDWVRYVMYPWAMVPPSLDSWDHSVDHVSAGTRIDLAQEGIGFNSSYSDLSLGK